LILAFRLVVRAPPVPPSPTPLKREKKGGWVLKGWCLVEGVILFYFLIYAVIDEDEDDN